MTSKFSCGTVLDFEVSDPRYYLAGGRLSNNCDNQFIARGLIATAAGVGSLCFFVVVRRVRRDARRD
jgi:hypothetical protein